MLNILNGRIGQVKGSTTNIKMWKVYIEKFRLLYFHTKESPRGCPTTRLDTFYLYGE